MLASSKAESQTLDVSRRSARVFPVSQALKLTLILLSDLLALAKIPGPASPTRQTNPTGVSRTTAIKLQRPASVKPKLVKQES